MNHNYNVLKVRITSTCQRHRLLGRIPFGLATYLSALGVVLSRGLSGGAPDVTYTVQGRVHYEDPAFKTAADIAFTVCVSNCLWSITTVLNGSETIDKQVYDGEVVSSGTSFPAHLSKASTIGNDATLGIEKTDMPNCLSLGVGQVWLAYCSACKFSGRTNGPMELVWFVDRSLRTDHFTTPASWRIGQGSPFLPISADYFFDSDSFGKAAGLDSRPPATALWTSYRATAFINVGSLVLPKEFNFQAFSPGKRSPVYTYRGYLTKAYESIAAGAFDHAFGRKTLVEDERFVSPSNRAAIVSYVTTNKTIPPTNDPAMVTAAIRAKISQVPYTGKPP